MKTVNTSSEKLTAIGLGGGCHWCTEAVYASLKGISSVEQGWITSEAPNDTFSEAILIRFDEQIISLQDIIDIHLNTHSSTSNHTLRERYRSAIYVMTQKDNNRVKAALKKLQEGFIAPLITQPLPFIDFKKSEEIYVDYFYKNPDKPFCQTYIQPKLNMLLQRYSNSVEPQKLK